MYVPFVFTWITFRDLLLYCIHSRRINFKNYLHFLYNLIYIYIHLLHLHMHDYMIYDSKLNNLFNNAKRQTMWIWKEKHIWFYTIWVMMDGPTTFQTSEIYRNKNGIWQVIFVHMENIEMYTCGIITKSGNMSFVWASWGRWVWHFGSLKISIEKDWYEWEKWGVGRGDECEPLLGPTWSI